MNRKTNKDRKDMNDKKDWKEWKSTERLDRVDKLDRNPVKECGKHDKRIGEDDRLSLRICETCGRHYYNCELCRMAKEIDAPSSICIRCASAYRTMKNILDKKDLEIYELSTRVRRYEQEMKKVDEMKKQLGGLKKTNEELRHELKVRQDELASLRRENQELENQHDEISEDLRSKEELTRDLKNLLNTPDYHDCVITSNGQKYQTHKCVLSIRSETLKNMIQKQLSPAPVDPKSKKSSQTSQRPQDIINIDIDDVEQKMMPFFLNYIYTGNTDGISDQNVQSVMKLADRYELGSLRGACLLFMENRLNKSTVIPILIEAYELNNERLKNKCMRYIQEQNIDLLSSPQWNNFKNENPKLALSLYERYIKETSTSGAPGQTENGGQHTARTNTNLNSNRNGTHASLNHWQHNNGALTNRNV